MNARVTNDLAYFYLNREIQEDTLVPKVHYRFSALFF